MSRLKCHHRPRVYKAGPVWWSECSGCGWWRHADDWHTAYVFSLDHAESSLT